MGRNVGLGPDYFTVDIRVKRRFSLVEDKTLEQFRSSYEGRREPVTKPFSYTSRFLGRQFQVSLRITF